MSSFPNLDAVAAVGSAAVDPLAAVSKMQSLSTIAQTGAPAGLDAAAAPGGFGAMVSAGLTDTNNRLNTAETALQSLAVGGAGNLQGVMVSMEGAKLAFQLVAQVRTQLLTAYQDIVKMQI